MLRIEPVYNLRDKVYIIYRGQICQASVDRIEIVISKNRNKNPDLTIVKYYINYDDISNSSWHLKSEMYDTKEEAALVWLKSQGLDVGLKE